MCIVYCTCFLARGDSNGEHTTGVVPGLAVVGRNWVMSGTGVTHTATPSLDPPPAGAAHCSLGRISQTLSQSMQQLSFRGTGV